MLKTEKTQTAMARARTDGSRLRRLLVGVTVLALSACAAPAGVSTTQQSLERSGVPSVSASMLELAGQLTEEGKYAAALPLYRRARSLDGGNEQAAVGFGNALLKTGRSREALAVFEDAAGSFSRSAAPLEGMGRAWMAMGRPGAALEAFEGALGRDPASASAMNGKGVALASLGRTREAVETFEAGLRRAPDDLALKNNYGLALTLTDQADLGLPVLEEVALDDRARTGHRQSLAMAYGVAGQTEDARQMAAIDLDLIDVERQVASYRTLAALPAEQRAAAAMSSQAAEKRDLSKPANRVFLEPVEAHATVRRLLTRERTAAVAPTPAPAPPAVEEYLDIPPLDDHVGYAVQIAAYRHAAELNPGWEELKGKYEALIGHLEPRRSEVDFGNRNTDPSGFYYRLNAGPLNSYSAARQICDAISARGGDCWVRPPLPTEGQVPTADRSSRDNGAAPDDAAIAATVEPRPAEGGGDVWVAIDSQPAEELPAAADGAQFGVDTSAAPSPGSSPYEEVATGDAGDMEAPFASVSEADVY